MKKVKCISTATYNGSHLKLPGLSWGIPVAPYQPQCHLARGAESDHVIRARCRIGQDSHVSDIDHGVHPAWTDKEGNGGLPQSNCGTVAGRVLAAYPTANVLCATPEDLAKFDRQEFMSRIATGAWDVVIVPMSSFKSLPVGPEVEERFVELQKAELEIFLQQLKDEGAGYRSRKLVEKALKNFEPSWMPFPI